MVSSNVSKGNQIRKAMAKSGLGQFSDDKTGSKERKLDDASKIEPKLSQSEKNKDKKKKKKDGSGTIIGDERQSDKTTSSGTSDFENKVL